MRLRDIFRTDTVVSPGVLQSMEEAEAGDAPQGGAPMRTILDEEGQSWTVREYVRQRGGADDRSLLFDCGMAIRRVRDFPDGWFELDNEALLRVSRRR